MNRPLSIIRGRDGIIRDEYGRPIIVIFKSKPCRSMRDKLATDDTCLLEAAQNDIQPLEFINVSGATKENSAARTLIRTHVMQDYKRQKMAQKARASKARKTEALKRVIQVTSREDNDNSFWTSFPSPQPSGLLDPFARYPVRMQPYMYRLIHHCRYITFVTYTPG
jgi:hypothetical protein